MFRNIWTKIACIPFVVLVMIAAVLFSPSVIQQAQAANYPDESEVYFEFENFGEASRPHVMSFHEYGQRTGWRTIDGVPTYRYDYIKETGIFYNKSDGTLTIDGYDPETRALFGDINRVFVVSSRAADLTVVINDDWESIQSAIRWVPKEQYSHTHGAIIANDSGGKLIVSSSNGSEVHFVSGKNNGNMQHYNPIGIYSKGRVDICGSIDLHITATNKHNSQDYVDADGRGYNMAWGIWAGSTVNIRDTAKTSISVNASYKPYQGVTSSAIHAGNTSGRVTDPIITVSSTAEQSFKVSSGSEATMAVFTLAPSRVPYVDDALFFKYDSNGGNHTGVTPRITCSWENKETTGHFVSAYDGSSTADPAEKSGYVLIRNESATGNDGNATYYSTAGNVIIKPQVRHTMPRIGQRPDAAADFDMVTPGLKLEDAKYYYTPYNYSDGSWVEVKPDGDTEYFIPANAKAVKVEFTLGAQDGYELAKPYRPYGYYYTICDFNGQEVQSKPMGSNDTTATFEAELDVDELIPANFVQYVSVMGVTAPKPGVRVPRAISSTQVKGSEDVELPAGDSVNYELAYPMQNHSSIPESMQYREWWTNDRGQVLNPNSGGATTFEATRTYTYHLLLQAKDGYVFGGGKYDDISQLHLFINGYPAVTLDDQYRYPESRQRYIHLTRNFKCPPNSVDEVEVYDVPVPAIGGQARLGTTADPIGTVAEGSVYKINYDRWYQGLDYTSGMGITEDYITGYPFTGTFQPNTWYTYQAELVPINSTYAFNATQNAVIFSGITAYVNGSKCGTMVGGQYRNTVRYDPSTGVLKVRYSFYVTAAPEDTVSNIELATPLFGLDYPNNVYHRANSLTEGVATVGMENAPRYSSIATDDKLAALKGKTSIWLDGDSLLENVYNQAVFGGTTATLTSQFQANSTYTFYSVVDLGGKSFAYDTDGNVTTKITVNGIPAELYPGQKAGGVDNTHKALVKMVYQMPANASSCWLIVPNKVYVRQHGTKADPSITNRNGFDWYNFDYTNDYTLNNVQSNSNSWQPPAGEQFWKWVCLTENFSIDSAYSRSVYIDSNVMDGEDLAFDILTAPKGQVPVDISTKNNAIRINEWGNNWGGSSSSTTAIYDGLAKKRWPVTIVNNAGTTSDTSDDYTLIEGKDYTVSYIDSAGNPIDGPTNVGSYKTVITGIGNYDGTREVGYGISAAEIGRAIVAFTGANYDYSTDPAKQWFYWTGEQQKPAFTVTFNGKALEEGTDYTIEEWGSNTNVGSGYVRIKGIGNFRGTPATTFEIRARDVGEALVAEVPDQAYTGDWIEPAVTVTYEGETLVEDTHYTVSYASNMNAGTAKITITGKPAAGWTGQREVTFTILPVDLNDEVVSFDPISPQYYTGEYITNPSIYGSYVVGGVTRHLYKNGEFEIVSDGFTNNLFPGEASLTVKGKGNYTGTRTLPFDIYVNMGDITVSGIESSYTYTGEEIKPKPTAVYLNSSGHGSMALSEGTDYTLTYEEDTISTGNKIMKIIPVDTEHFTYSWSTSYYITQHDISEATVAPIPDQAYTHDAITPDVEVTYGGASLPSSDYSVTFSNNHSVGTATVTIDGYGNWTGSTTKTFKILPQDIGDAEKVSFACNPMEYTGSAITSPNISGWQGSYSLYENTDYTVTSTDNNLNPGTATATVEGTGNYTGTREVPFDIYVNLYDTSSVEYSGVNTQYTWTGSAIEPKPVVKLSSGKELVEGTDYLLDYKDNTDVGTASVTVLPKDEVHYKSNEVLYFQIVKRSIEDATVEAIPDQVWEGSAVEPKPVVTYKGTVLEEGTDYTLSYSDNNEPGTGTVTITGSGRYEDSVSVTFRIAKKSIKDATVGAIADQTYTGSALKPALVIADGSKTLEAGTDYEVAYEDNVKAGTAKAIVTGIGDYGGTITVSFKIVPAGIEDASVASIATQTYSGAALKPAVKVTYKGETLAKGTDYTVAYKNNTDAGTATVTVTGKGNFKGTKSATFKIVPKDMSAAVVSGLEDKVADGREQVQKPTIKLDGKTLKANVDYTLSYKNNVEPGTATMTATGKGNYKGTVKATFAVLDPTAQLGEDGTALGAGASVEAAEAALAAYKGEESPEGTAFVLLQAKMSKVSKTYVKLKWKKAKGAKSYVIYGNKCGKKNKYLKIKYVSGTSVKLKKVNGKKVKKGTYYKFVVVAVTGKKGTGNVVSTSVTVHAATKGGKVGNDKKVTLSKKKATLKKGKTLKLKAKVTPESKKLKVKRHRKTVWESSNPKVATVSKSGKVKAKKKGKAVIWAYAQDGVAAKCKVTVK